MTEIPGSGEPAAAEEPKRAGRRRRPRPVRIALAVLLVLAIVVAGVLWRTALPDKAAGLTAQTICSGVFVAGRDPETVRDHDVLPQSVALHAVGYDIDPQRRTVRARIPGLADRTAAHLPDRGCVLDAEPAEAAGDGNGTGQRPAPWPAGDGVAAAEAWPAGLDPESLHRAVDAAFDGSEDPAATATRAVLVAVDGRLLVQRLADGFDPDTPQLGWSMTKTVNAMLFALVADEHGVDLDTAVVDAFPAGREPGWVADWRGDDRRAITVGDLVYMRSGLDFVDDYSIFGKVVEMLYRQPDMAAYAASQPLSDPPGTRFGYSTGVANILSALARAYFADDESYWRYPREALFDPLGLTTATFATDTDGNWVGGSYLWAAPADWARLGQLVLDRGRWDGRQLLPQSWADGLTERSVPGGAGAGYGAQIWLPGDPDGGECRRTGLPGDTLAMQGHYGQLVVVVPSRDAVLVRLGWTVDPAAFDHCRFMADLIAELPD